MTAYLDPRVPDADDADPATASATAKKSKKAAADKLAAGKTSLSAELGAFLNPVAGIYSWESRLIVLAPLVGALVMFVYHCTHVTQSAYSSPSVVLASRNPDGSQHIIDDFREAYYWLRQNTKEDAVVMSWWDYGYQIAGMADRPTLVDNNTWNNSVCRVAVLWCRALTASQ